MDSRFPTFISFFLALLWIDIPPSIRADTPAFRRTDDPIVLEGARFPRFFGKTADEFRLARCGAAGFELIPFQLDEKTDDGNYAYSSGPGATKDSRLGLDANDELIFMAVDVGPHCLNRPALPGSIESIDIEVSDPVDGTKGWVYLFVTPATAPRLTVDRVKADFEGPAWRLEGETYALQIVKNSLYYDYLTVRHRDGTWSPNLVDRMKIRGSFSFFFNTININFAVEERTNTELIGWIDGPLRIVYEAEGHFSAIIRIPIRGLVLAKAYPTFFVFPMHVDIPVDMGIFLSTLTLRGLHEFNRNVYPYKIHVYDKFNTYQTDVVLDGILSPAEWQLNYNDDRDWIAFHGEQAGGVQRVVLPKSWGFVKKQLYYGENPEQPDPPESEKGILAVGYELDGVIDIPKGPNTVYLNFYFPKNFDVGDEKQILEILDRPLTTEIRARR